MQIDVFDIGERVRFIRDGWVTLNGHRYRGPTIVEGEIVEIKFVKKLRWQFDATTRQHGLQPVTTVSYRIQGVFDGRKQTIVSQRQHTFERVVPLAPAAPAP